MRVRILPSSPDAERLQHLVSFVVNGRLAIDAGCLGLAGSPRDQSAIAHVVLTHSHADHTCSLPIFAMNVCDAAGRGITVHAPEPVLDSLKTDVFNWRVWPDFTAIQHQGRPMVTLEPIEVRKPVVLGGLSITAIPVNHPVPTVGYLVDDGTTAVLFAVDTGPTEEIWDEARRNVRLAAAFVDAAFPDRLTDLAAISGHLTPTALRQAMGRLPDGVPRIAVHLKPAYVGEVVRDLEQAQIPNLTVGQIGFDYEI